MNKLSHCPKLSYKPPANVWAAVVGCAALLSACIGAVPDSGRAGAHVQPALTASPSLLPARYDGYGSLRFGMNAQKFTAAWGGALQGLPLPSPEDACHTVYPIGATRPAAVSFMFENRRFVRYDVTSARQIAPGGGAVGMEAATLRALYGAALQSEPHKYVLGALDLRVTAPSGNSALVFETDAQGMQGKIVRWHAGVPPQVDYVEGCA